MNKRRLWVSIFWCFILLMPSLHVSAQVSSCPNADFEQNSFAGWSGRTGDRPFGGCCPINCPVPGIVPGRHTIMTAGFDPNVNNLLSVVAPGGSYSVRLGNDGTGSQAEQLSYSFLVTPQTQLFIYRYAVVLQDPGHNGGDQPRFEIRVFDQNGVLIDTTCGVYSVIAGGGIPGFQDAIDTTFNNDYPQDTVRWKDWTAVGIDLSSKLGSTVTIEFSTGDCALGAHYGYAYIDCMCNTFNVTNDFCPGSINATLTAPAGFAHYSWTTGATTQSITINNPVVGDSVSVTMTTENGCQVTLTSTMRVTSIGAAFTQGDSCYNAASFMDSSYIIVGTPVSSWLWNFGDGTTSSLQNPVHTFPAVGNYTVTLIAANQAGCADTIVKQIGTRDIPYPNFSYVPECPHDPTSFTDSSFTNIGNIANLLWNFGDSSATTSATNPVHTFNAPGIYNVSLTATDNIGCKNTIVHPVSTLPSPDAGFKYTTNCINRTISFTDTSKIFGGVVTSWKWYFGDGSPTSGLQSPTHTYAAAGVYTVSLVVVVNGNCSDSISQPVSVLVFPSANFNAPSQCANAPFSFFNQSLFSGGTITGYSWNFGDGSPLDTSANPMHVYNQTDTFAVTLTVMGNSGCTGTITKNVITKPLPTVVFTVTGACIDQTAHFSSQSSLPGGSITSLTWDFGDFTPTVTGSNPSHTYYSTGNFDVTLIATASNGCIDTLTQNVRSHNPPHASFQTPSGCPVSSITFSSNSTSGGWGGGGGGGGSISSTQWNFGDGSPLGNGTSTSHVYSTGGSYNVTLYVTNNYGCIDSVTHQIVLLSSPTANFSTSDQCLNATNSFTDLSAPNGGSINGWSWNFGDGSPLANIKNPTHHYNLVDTFTVVLTVSTSNGCTATTTKNVIIKPLPTVAFTYSGLCPGQPGQFNSQSSFPPGSITSLSWNFGDGTPTVSGTSPTHIYNIANNYNVTLIATASNGCKDTLIQNVGTIAAPTAIFPVPTGCPGIPLNFQSLSNAGVGVITGAQWNFGDGSAPATGNSTTHTYVSNGGYNVTLTITSSSGCTAFVMHPVALPALPVANINATGACIGQTTLLYDATLPVPSTVIGWSWNFGDGSPVDHNPNPSHIYNNDSSVQVTLIVTNADGCIDTTTKSIFIQPLPQPHFTIQSNLCADAIIHIADSTFSPTGVSQHQWSFGDGTFASGTATPAHTYALPGNYTITLTTTAGNGCVDSISKPVTIMNPPTAAFNIPVGCPGVPVNFQNNSTPGSGTVTTAQWNFGDGPLLTSGNSVSHVYLTGGGYNVTLYVNSNSGCIDSITQPVNIPNAPVANITATGACVGQPTLLYDATLPVPSAVVGWSWYFGDGSPVDHNPNPSHIYNNDSLVQVTLIITNADGCIDTTSKSIFIQPLPQPHFTIHNSLCAGEAVLINDSSYSPTGITQHQWYLGDGTFASGVSSVSHTYVIPGSYTITLTTTAGNGCVDSISKPVVIKNLPNVYFTFTNKCQLQPYLFYDQSGLFNGNIVHWNWAFGDGDNDTLKNPVHTYNLPGIHNVTLQVTGNNGCKKDTTLKAYVNPLPDSRFHVGTICKGSPANFIDSSVIVSGTIKEWYWKFGDGSFTGNIQFPTHTFTNDSNYLVELKTVSDSGCVDTTAKTVIVHSLPVPLFLTDSVCFGQPNSFINHSVIRTDSIIHYEWNFGDGTLSTVRAPNHFFNTTGNHTVILTAQSNFGCVDSSYNGLHVYRLPVADFIADDRDGCQPLKVNFTDLSIPQEGVINQWSWLYGDGDSDSTKNPSHIYNDYGMFDVKLTVTTNLHCSDHKVKPKYITVHPKPVAAFSYTPDKPDMLFPTVYFHDESQFATSWFYILGEGATSTSSDPMHTYGSIGNYHIMQAVSTPFGCRDTAYGEIIINDVYTLYIPNSFTPDNDGKNDYFSAYGTGIVDFNMRIFNRWGQPVFESHDMSQTWDGQASGKYAKEDVYYYLVKITDVFKKQHSLTGRVTVVR